MASFT